MNVWTLEATDMNMISIIYGIYSTEDKAREAAPVPPDSNWKRNKTGELWTRYNNHFFDIRQRVVDE